MEYSKLQLALLISIFVVLVASGAVALRTFSTSSAQETAAPQASPSTQALTLPSQAAEIDVSKLYSLINAYRVENELTELHVHPALESSAYAKLRDMIANEYWRHEDNENIQSWYLFTQSGYDYTVAGENLAFGLNTPWQVFDGWVKSDRHRQELLTEEYTDMGVAKDCETYKIKEEKSCIVVLHLGAD